MLYLVDGSWQPYVQKWIKSYIQPILSNHEAIEHLKEMFDTFVKLSFERISELGEDQQ